MLSIKQWGRYVYKLWWCCWFGVVINMLKILFSLHALTLCKPKLWWKLFSSFFFIIHITTMRCLQLSYHSLVLFIFNRMSKWNMLKLWLKWKCKGWFKLWKEEDGKVSSPFLAPIADVEIIIIVVCIVMKRCFWHYYLCSYFHYWAYKQSHNYLRRIIIHVFWCSFYNHIHLNIKEVTKSSSCYYFLSLLNVWIIIHFVNASLTKYKKMSTYLLYYEVLLKCNTQNNSIFSRTQKEILFNIEIWDGKIILRLK